MRQINSAFQYIYGMLFIAVLIGCSGNRQPNFVFILVDDLGWKDLGCYGSEFYETPHIDRLASKSMLFTDAYASCPVCSPTRASIMTGKYPSRLNITDWIPGSDPKDKKLLGPQDL
ncbi:MAG: sulfatase-like hydrolase/transferase, partial [Cyclobacteriaceae bacterium]|nr:sulfatase-like hydrolase/transferase [Cyclobacteriaceae bacterium]